MGDRFPRNTRKNTLNAKRYIDLKIWNLLKTRYLRTIKKLKSAFLLLDYDGTLQTFHNDPQQAYPDKALYDILEKLSKNSNNTVVIISGRDKDTLDKWFGNRNLKLIAEHGVWVCKNNEWVMTAQMNDEWKDIFRPIIQWYVDRTPVVLRREKLLFSLALPKVRS